jgi:hypothetical protein
LHAEQQAMVGPAYHSSSSEGGHEEMYPYVSLLPYWIHQSADMIKAFPATSSDAYST